MIANHSGRDTRLLLEGRCALSKTCKDIFRNLLNSRIEARLSQLRHIEIVKSPTPLNGTGREYRRPVMKGIDRHVGHMGLPLEGNGDSARIVVPGGAFPKTRSAS